MDKIPILIDTEAETETSMEQDVEENIRTKVSNATLNNNATKSLFNITLENFDEEKHESVKFKDYESRLHQEMKDWKSLIYSAYKDLKQSKQKHPVVDKSILPSDKLEYLGKAYCLQNLIRDSMEFKQQASLFLEYDYAELKEMVDNLEKQCAHKVDLLKARGLAQNLANINRKFNN